MGIGCFIFPFNLNKLCDNVFLNLERGEIVGEIVLILHVGELKGCSLTVMQHGKRLIKTFYFEL